MVLFSILFIEPYYSSPKNVVTNTIPLLLVLLSIKTSFSTTETVWWIGISILLFLIFISIVSISLQNKDSSSDSFQNKLSNILKDTAVFFGRGKVIYSIFFLYFLLTYYSIQDIYTIINFVLWFLIISINPKELHNEFISSHRAKKLNQVGEIISVQAKRMFLVKLFEDKSNLNKFDIVKFKYSMQDKLDLVYEGIIFDTYILNKEKWAKIYQISSPQNSTENLEKNIIYQVTDDNEIQELNTKLKVDRFVGAVIENSRIDKIVFEYSKKNNDLQQGDLVELLFADKRIFYQVIDGCTDIEKLEEKNEFGMVRGEAIQLGEWNESQISFDKFGWVPSINTPVFKADTTDINVSTFSYPKYKLGMIPGTTLPSVIDLSDAISHHIALLGVTGSGKSFIAREIIDQIKRDTKVICVDFNKEFSSTLSPAPNKIISDLVESQIVQRINWLSTEFEKFGNQQNKQRIASAQQEITSFIKQEIESFLNNRTCSICVFELPDVSNTTGIFEYTKYFFKVLFDVAKEKKLADNPSKICVVLEEAHTIVPEWNFSGSTDKISQGLVNSIGQIALQGRKYGIGFIVIAQRTANVSKTVLTQCNTVICFQAFDDTSLNFLSNYVGKQMIQALPNMKRFHAIVAGKAMSTNLPIIVDLTR
ncbi:MAG: hypothetical protein PWQ55_488 [Chloroflexota bacterium]|nr:hypothetical protein [Chloroflexota bacterium]